MNKLITYDLVLNDELEGVSTISLVESPAIERNFIMMSKEESTPILLSKEKQIITTPVLIANKPIYRRNQQFGEHYVKFTKKTIEQVVQKYFKEGNMFSFNLEHSEETSGIFLFESYIVNRERGINPPIEFKDIPDGSWMASFKIENSKLWEACKAGQFRGVSVECFMTYKKDKNLGLEFSEEELDMQYFIDVYKELGKLK